MNIIFQQFFKSSPITGDALKVIFNYRTFKKTYKFLQESLFWSREQLEEYQLVQLKKLLHHAYKNVPYYTKSFNSLGIKPNDIEDFKDLQKLPYLTKKILKENINDFKAKNYPKHKFELITTGGSTGEPLGLYLEKGIVQANYTAYNQSFLDIANCNFKNKHSHLSGSENLCKYQAFGRVMIISSFYMSDKNLAFYVEKIKKFKPRFIVTFPSAITILAKFMDKNNIKSFPSIKTVICGGEIIYEEQRELIEKTFQCRVHAIYSHAELVVFATTCKYSYNYHIYPQYGITELIDKNKKPINKKGEMGEIVGTGFINPIFPLIRYKTGDMGILANQKCECGKNYLLLKSIIGRTQQFIISKTNRLIPLLGLYGLVARCTQNVKELQFLQEKEGEINLTIVKEKNYSHEDENLIKKSFSIKFKDEINLKINYIEKIPRSPRGKYQILIQKLPIEF